MDTFVKRDAAAPAGFFAAEAAGLAWLAEAEPHGGVPVVPVLEAGEDRIVLRRLQLAASDRAAAEEFGRRLAATHRAGAEGHGAPPPGRREHGFIGPVPMPHDLGAGPDAPWGSFYARCRLLPFARAAHRDGALPGTGLAAVERVCERLEAGDEQLTGPPERAARLHGDLWSGNVVWTPEGAVLIDPAAHGGHRETDLAMLALFGAPQLERILAAYDEAHPLAAGWRERVPLHQLHPLLVHAVIYGGGYGHQAATVARRLG